MASPIVQDGGDLDLGMDDVVMEEEVILPEPQTQASSEPQTQAPSEPQTQALTETVPAGAPPAEAIIGPEVPAGAVLDPAIPDGEVVQ